MPYCTIVVPVYDRLQYLQECLTSINGAGSVVVMCDSADSEFCRKVDTVVRNLNVDGSVQHTNHAGLWTNVNQACKEAQTEWVRIVCDDDYLDNVSAVSQRALDAADADVLVGYYTNIHSDGSRWSPAPNPIGPINSSSWLRRLVLGNPLQLCAVTFRRSALEAIGWFDTDLTYTADWDCYLRLTINGARWRQVDGYSYYRIHTNNLSGELSLHKKLGDMQRTLAKVANTNMCPEPEFQQALTRLQLSYLEAAVAAANTGQYHDMLGYMEAAVVSAKHGQRHGVEYRC